MTEAWPNFFTIFEQQIQHSQQIASHYLGNKLKGIQTAEFDVLKQKSPETGRHTLKYSGKLNNNCIYRTPRPRKMAALSTLSFTMVFNAIFQYLSDSSTHGRDESIYKINYIYTTVLLLKLFSQILCFQ